MSQPAVRLINVSNRLPVTLADDGIKKSSGGLVAALEGLPKGEFDPVWIGWPGREVEEAEQPALKDLLVREHGCTPVFFPKDLADAHYEGMSNSSIWPLLHYMPSRFTYDPAWWDAYEQVNRKFAEAVLAVAQDGDLVWVHDYQLMLLPKMLKEANRSLRVGFFLHTPFPSYEVFRCHPHREALVDGMLGADLVGFHTFSYLRHFRSCALRLLGVESDVMTARHDGRSTAMGVYPIGINAGSFERELAADRFHEELAKLRRTHGQTRVIVSVERLDYTKGIIQRLDAIELFLKACAAPEKVRFIFIAVPSREGVEQYKTLREEIEYRVGRMNGQFATLHASPVQFIYGTVTFTELCALYALADVAIVTPLMDGMNLVAKEYVACQLNENVGRARRVDAEGPAAGSEPGVLVLSEFAGAAEELFGALIVNPYDAPAVASAMEKALSMPAAEKRERMAGMHRRVTSFDAKAWARTFVKELSARPTTDQSQSGGSDLAQVRERLRSAVRDGRAVALFLDYDGTLREIVRDPSTATVTADLRRLLDRLAECANVDVTIVSGRLPQDLENFVGSYSRFGLVAEHGAAFRRPGSSEWERTDRESNYTWKEPVRNVLRLFEESTPGTWVEEKRAGFVWHYRRADPEFGDWKAKELVMELSGVVGNEPVLVRLGRKIVEAVTSQVSKGAAVGRVLAERRYDLTFIAGDDTTDEAMFRLDLPPETAITVKVGDAETSAGHRVATPAALRSLLESAIG